MSDSGFTHLCITLSGGNQINLHGEANRIESRENFIDSVTGLKQKAIQKAVEKAVKDHQTRSILTPEQANAPINVPPVMNVFHSFVTLDGKQKDIDVLAIQVVEEWEAPIEELLRMKGHLEELIEEMS